MDDSIVTKFRELNQQLYKNQHASTRPSRKHNHSLNTVYPSNTITIETETKKCIWCGTEKPISEFYKDNSYRKDRHMNHCKACHNQYYKNGYGLNSRLRFYHGITLKEYNEKLQAQNHSCAICGRKLTRETRTSTPSVDHDHETGKIRGLLCGECNKGIGLFKDSSVVIDKAIKYLEKTNAN